MTAANSYVAAFERKAGQARLVFAVDSLSDGFVHFDAQERLVLANRRYRELHAANAAAIVAGARFEDILRSGIAHGCYPDASGREEKWLRQRLEAFRAARPMVNRLADGTVLEIVEHPTEKRAGLREVRVAMCRQGGCGLCLRWPRDLRSLFRDLRVL